MSDDFDIADLVPPPGEMLMLAVALYQLGVRARFNESGELTIDVGDLATIWVAGRPVYCDRGRFLVHAESHDDTRLTIDRADGFPRYYFGVDACATEIVAWLKARSLSALTNEVQAAACEHLWRLGDDACVKCGASYQPYPAPLCGQVEPNQSAANAAVCDRPAGHDPPCSGYAQGPAASERPGRHHWATITAEG